MNPSLYIIVSLTLQSLVVIGIVRLAALMLSSWTVVIVGLGGVLLVVQQSLTATPEWQVQQSGLLVWVTLSMWSAFLVAIVLAFPRIRDIRDTANFERALVSALPDSLYVVRGDGLLLDMGPRTCPILTSLGENTIHQPISKVWPAELVSAATPAIAQTLKSGTLSILEHSLPIPGGNQDLEVRVSQLDRQRVLLLIRDVTERNQAIERQFEQLARMAHVGRLSALGEMLAEVAHEVHQPLYAIANFAAACQRRIEQTSATCPDSAIEEWVEEIRRSALQGGEIVNRLRTFVKSGPLQPNPVDLDHLIREAVELLRSLAKQSQTAVALDIPQNLPKPLADPLQVQQVLVNLVRNALESVAKQPPPGRVEVGVIPKPEYVLVEVSDNGPGLNPDDLNRVFDLFYTTKPEGLGIGLAISKTIVEAHNGRIGVRNNSSQTGAGVTFWFQLPLSTTLKHTS